MKKIAATLLVLGLGACASYSGYGLKTEAEVLKIMGPPALRWTLPDGGTQLAYPRGPAGYQTYMIFTDRDGRIVRNVNALEPETLARVQPGQTQEEVLQLIGPPQPQWTAYFAARDELVWEWRVCDDWHEASRFDVLFDGHTKTVRTAYSRTESSFFYARGPDCQR